MEVDEALTRLGRYSRWQMLSYALLSICAYVPGCWHMLSIVFIGGMPDYNCNVSSGTILPKKKNLEDELITDPCREYVDLAVDNTTETCSNGYNFSGDFELTIVDDYMLVCEQEYLVELSQTIFVVGVMFGAIACTSLADMYGRKWVHLACQWILVVVGVVTAFAHNYEFFLFLRFLTGALQQGIILAAFVQGCEIFAADQRTFAGLGVNIVWAIAMMVLAGLAYALRNWRYFQLAITLPGIWSIAGIWFFPESIPWLVANGKIDRAEDIIKKAAKMNGVEKNYPKNIFPRHEREEKSEPNDEAQTETAAKKSKFQSMREKLCGKDDGEIKKENIFTVLKHAKLRVYVFVMCSLWFVNSLVYFGLSLSTSALAGDRYLNFFLSGAVELPAYIQCLIVLGRYGRRVPLCVYHAIAGIGLMVTLAIPKTTAAGDSLNWLSIIFTMIGKFGITCSFGTIFLYAGEIFPTNVRNTGMGMCSVAARIGGMLAPFSTLLARKIPWLPGVIFGVLSIIVGGLTLLLPETLGQPLPQTIDDMKQWNRKRRKSSHIITPIEDFQTQSNDTKL
ncbi:organic cation transporter protein-like [Tubulanus polymorphus]|uniref:organic cation transporter protein-like n=1 Tax=Tubulanus polymorphus TaxID=672921 RepID=UPI003DA45A7D